MKQITGYITIVQEDRFRLTTDDGRGLLFTLISSARAKRGSLRDFCDRHCRVDVEYQGEPDYEDGVATLVQPSVACG